MAIRSLDLLWERAHWHQLQQLLAGADEVGRGALAGPVVTASVVFALDHQPLPGVYDSKLVSPTKRVELAEQIKQTALHWRVGLAEPSLVDSHGLTTAVRIAFENSLHTLHHWQVAAIDGRPFKVALPTNRSSFFVVKGDQRVYSIAAASILAKVYRDTLMQRLAQHHPEYGWESNVGYGSRAHRLAIQQHGPSQLHRRLFLRKMGL